jgi:hypothetical protein
MDTAGGTTRYCPHCAALRPHSRVVKYDHWGSLTKVVEACEQCRGEGLSHEAPLADPPRPLVFTGIEAARLLEARYRHARGLLHDEVPR